MAVNAQWENDEKTIMCWTFEGAWQWEQYFHIRTTTNQQIHAQKHTVDLIVDLTRTTLLPSSVLMHARSAVMTAPSNIGVTVLVSANPVLHAFFNMFRNLYRGLIHNNHIDMVMVMSLDDAYKLLAERRVKNA
ncbi:MAG: hypothetical protein U0694_17495 [Anaerolineae bacterium]